MNGKFMFARVRVRFVGACACACARARAWSHTCNNFFCRYSRCKACAVQVCKSTQIHGCESPLGVLLRILSLRSRFCSMLLHWYDILFQGIQYLVHVYKFQHVSETERNIAAASLYPTPGEGSCIDICQIEQI